MTSLKKPLVYVGIIASDMIGFKNTPSSMLDVQLFLVRHLLILNLGGVMGMSIIRSSS